MANLTSTAPAAWTSLYNLLIATALQQTPPATVVGYELLQYQPGAYVMLTEIENHIYDIETIGSYTHKEQYELTGVATVFQGDVDPPTVLAATYALYQSVVVDTVVTNRGIGTGDNTLGIVAPGQGPYMVTLSHARYSGGPGNLGGGPGGFYGRIDWSILCKGYLTVG